MALSVVDRLFWSGAAAYAVFSVYLLARCVYGAYEKVRDPLISKLSEESLAGRTGDENDNDEELYATVLWSLATDSYCIWVLVNTVCCFLLLMAKCIQIIVFGDLRINEKQTEGELVMWCLWFIALLFLQLLAQLCKDRFEYLSFTPTTTLSSHKHVLLVLMCLLVSYGGLTVIFGHLGYSNGMHTLSFMAVEGLMVIVYMSHVIIRCIIHLYDLSCEGSWDDKEVYIYYTDFIMDMGILCLDLMHHIHMLLYWNSWFSVADLIILTQLRVMSQEMQHRLLRHKTYLHIFHVMDIRFSMATLEELASHDDRCAICLEKMRTACKLPCGHLFHMSCLRSWLEQDMSCPTCRISFNISARSGHTTDEQEGASLRGSLGPATEPSPNSSNQSPQSHSV
ncbi:E3 ubiquitin-protein ligase AMFR isoform X2 [Myxocyprinus asiaticus]|uniref:E3 ubiquitin-protein ligase AMFR isoform X2 n=1 Tax=Myxocyprinus asiaticus TaxID=70543 RepID=UPI002223DB2B|nr:E3 ubiquitin-protein ligase AMFR isoform X2 [Myxocyprinus asiaticus]